MRRVLVLCTHNSARSQMAEGWIRELARRRGLEVEVRSAGTERSAVKPEAVKVMAEVGLDITSHTSKAILELDDPWTFDLVITVCDDAREACPAYPARTSLLHVGFPDPTGHGMMRWREVRDAIGRVALDIVVALACGRTPREDELGDRMGGAAGP